MTTTTEPTTELMTEAALRALAPDGLRHELVKGALRTMPPAGSEHGAVAMECGWRLARHVKERGLGLVFAAETGFVLARDPDTVRAADVAFVSRERVERTGLVKGYWPGPPDLAVEVISPNDAYSEVEEKALEWLEAGTRLVLALDPRRRTLTAYRSPSSIAVLGPDSTLDLDEIVPGFQVIVGALFG